jgi:hypothetical protein
LSHFNKIRACSIYLSSSRPNGRRRVGAAMIQDVEPVEKRGVVSHERLDDVALAADGRDGGKAHVVKNPPGRMSGEQRLLAERSVSLGGYMPARQLTLQ